MIPGIEAKGRRLLTGDYRVKNGLIERHIPGANSGLRAGIKRQQVSFTG